jgi:hypothetical protein
VPGEQELEQIAVLFSLLLEFAIEGNLLGSLVEPKLIKGRMIDMQGAAGWYRRLDDRGGCGMREGRRENHGMEEKLWKT